MTNDTRPRRFFGLLCAHQWEHWGTLKRDFMCYGTNKESMILKCQHCGDIKYTKPPRI
jgi:hypothetical protein